MKYNLRRLGFIDKIPDTDTYRDFWYLWISKICLISGFNVLCLALAWHMYTLTSNPLDLGLVGFLQFIPRLILILFTGVVVDNIDHKKILLFSNIAQACIVCGFIYISFGSLNNSSISMLVNFSNNTLRNIIFVLSFILGVFRTFDMPTYQAVLPDIVPKNILPKAITTNTFATHSATIVSPALGGFFYAINASSAYILCLFFYIISIFFISKLKLIKNSLSSSLEAKESIDNSKVDENKINITYLFGGINYIAKQKHILGAISLDLFAVLLGGAVALLPIFAHDILYVGPAGLGLLRSAPAAGSLCMSIFLIYKPITRHIGRYMFGAVGAYGLFTIVFGISTYFYLSLLCLILAGAADLISVVIRNSIIQLETPSRMRGRVGAVNSLFIGASNQLGEFESGVTAAFMGATRAVIFGGVCSIIVAASWIKIFPSIWHKDKL
jgi:MFS family permease